MYTLYIFNLEVELHLTLFQLGGGSIWPPPHISWSLRRAKFFDRETRWLFTFKSCANFKTSFAKIGRTVASPRHLLYMHVRPKMAQKRDFVYKVNGNWDFTPILQRCRYFHFYVLNWINFSINMLLKCSAIFFIEKTMKNKRSKKQRNT